MMIVMVPAMPASPPAPEPGTCKVALHLDRVSLSDIWECWGMHVLLWGKKTDRGRGWATRSTCQSVPRGTFCRGYCCTYNKIWTLTAYETTETGYSAASAKEDFPAAGFG